jgi:hypothetical protein
MLDDEYHLYLLNEKINEIKEELLKELLRLIPEIQEITEIQSRLNQIKELVSVVESKLKAKRLNRIR